MNDLIDRQKAIDALMQLQPYSTKRELINRIESSIADAEGYLGGIAMALDEIEDLPSEHPEDFEWCKDCKEYDHERGCCPKFNKVIKETVDEVKQNLKDEQTRWIPMEECFPDLDTYVLVQLTDIYYDPIQIMSLHLRQCTEQDDTWVVYWKTQEESIEFDARDVVAWMPLPEPYKENADDT